MWTVDQQLLIIYKQGFNDELSGIPEKKYSNTIETKAYTLGRIDAELGDDVKSLDEQTDEDILKRIKNRV